MLTKQFNAVIRSFVTDNITLKDVSGTTSTIQSYKSTVNNITRPCMIPELLKLVPPYGNASVGNGPEFAGVNFGDGDTPPTENDYNLSGSRINTAASVLQIVKTVTTDGDTFTGVYTLTNVSTNDITIKEIALIGAVYTGSSSGKTYLIDRNVLAEALTIPAGEVGRITYTITVS